MKHCLTLVLVLAAATATAASATAASAQPQNPATQQMGTPQQRAACRPDVRRFCRSVKPQDGPYAYLDCLQQHRNKLRPACLRVIGGGPP